MYLWNTATSVVQLCPQDSGCDLLTSDQGDEAREEEDK